MNKKLKLVFDEDNGDATLLVTVGELVVCEIPGLSGEDLNHLADRARQLVHKILHESD